jgi:formylglycine-generating enzyme required for sulfatase activity
MRPAEDAPTSRGVPMTFSFIPPGSFLMGSTIDENEQPVHKVTLTNGFFLGVHPVTQAQWKAVMKTDPSHFKGEQRPVESVSWDDSQEFCKKLTTTLNGLAAVRLPTEAEWEFPFNSALCLREGRVEATRQAWDDGDA